MPHSISMMYADVHVQKALNSYFSSSTVFKISVRAVQLLYDSKNKCTSNLEHLQHFDGNGIIVNPYKLLIIVHDCYTLGKPLVNDMHCLFIISHTLHY